MDKILQECLADNSVPKPALVLNFPLRAPCVHCGCVVGSLHTKAQHIEATCNTCKKHAYFVPKKDIIEAGIDIKKIGGAK